MKEIIKRNPGQEVKILLKFRLNWLYVKKIADKIGIRQRPPQEDREIDQQNTKLAIMMKRDPLQYKRHDAVGNKKADSGRTIFTRDKKGTALTFTYVWEDLLYCEYNLTTIDLFKKGDGKDEDSMFTLVLCFEKVAREHKHPDELINLLQTLLEKKFEHVHIWDNPDFSITINAAHIKYDVTYPELRIEEASQGLCFSYGSIFSKT